MYRRSLGKISVKPPTFIIYGAISYYFSQIDNRDRAPRDVPLACSRRSDRGDSAKRGEQKKKQRWEGWEESEGTPLRHFNKASSTIPDYGIPYDWSILRAVVIRGSSR